MSGRTEYSMKSVGKNLRKLREAKGLSVRDVRQYLKLGSVQAIYKYENGVSYPPLDKFLAMMELYDAQWQDAAYGPRGDISWDQQMYRRREKPLAVFEIQGNRREEHFKALADRLAKWMYDRTGNNP